MSQKIKFLILDDSEADLKLIKHELKSYFRNSEVECASNRKNFIIKLSHFKPDVVISDYHLPDFDGLTALKITHEMYPHLPFIIATDSASEEFGINSIKNGAYDYVLKKHLKKIPIVVEEALSKYELILENKRAYEELRKSEEKFRRLAENAQDLIYRYEFFPKRGFTYVSPSATKITGFTPEDHYKDPDLGFKIVHPDDRYILEKVVKGEIGMNEPITLRWFKKDGSIIWTEQQNVPIYDDKGNLIAIEGIARDVTERKRLEEALKESENKFRMISNLITDYAYSFNVDENLNLVSEWISESFIRTSGYSLKEIEEIGGWLKLIYHEDLAKVLEHTKKVIEGSPIKNEFRLITKFNEIRWIRNYAVPVFDNSSKRVIKIFGVAEDITEKKRLEEEIKNRTEHFENL
ncbi:MAG: PAS domain-containing protein, partial [candidate division WOR-3 bacterium]